MAGGPGGAQELHDLRDSPRLDEVLQQRAVLAGQLKRLLGWRLRVQQWVSLNEQCPADVSLAAAQPGAVLAADHEGLGAGRQVCRLAQASGSADGAEFA